MSNPYALAPYQSNNALSQARSQIAAYRGRVAPMVGAGKTAAEILGGAAIASYVSARIGGPSGAKIMNVPAEILIGGGLAVLATQAGEHRADVLALAIGAGSAYAARKGFEYGLKAASPEKTSGVGFTGPRGLAGAEATLDHLAAR